MTAEPETFATRTWTRSITAAVVVGLLNLVLTISLAALVFAGRLAPFLSEGIGLALLSAMVSGVLIGVLSSLRGMVGSVQDAASAVLAVAAAGAVTLMPARAAPEEIFATIVVANGATALIVGVFLLLTGVFGLGRLVRFLPYPVIGGFLAGMGWLILVGSVGVMADMPVAFGTLAELFAPGMLVRWVPGLVYAALVLAISERWRHALVWPALLVAPVAAFYAAMLLTGGTVEGWRAAGLLPPAFSSGSLFTIFDYGLLGSVHWPAVWSYAPTIVAMCAIVAISVLFNTTALELITERDLDLDRELRAAGVANLAIGTVGGQIGYQMLGDTTVVRQIGRGTRLEALASVGVVLLGLLFGGRFIPLIPQFLIGGFLAYIAFMFLRDWLVNTYRAVSRIEYAIIVAILVVIASVGFLEGVGLGILATVVLFVVDYGRADVVKHELTGATIRSRVARSAAALETLAVHGERTYVLELQGFVFFGTANGLVDRVRAHVRGHPDTRYAIVDFRRVTGVDATARLAFEKLARFANQQGVRLLLTNLDADVDRKLESVRTDGASGAAVEIHATLDAALEACEDRILDASDDPGDVHGLEGFLTSELGDADAARRLTEFFEMARFDQGSALITQGDAPDVLYIVGEGRVTAQLEREGQPPLRFETMAGPSLIGELGFYTGAVRSASVVADEPTTAYALSQEALDRMKAESPDLATAFTELVLRLLAKRTGHLMRVVDALQR